jgi:6-phosphogluconolactonase
MKDSPLIVPAADELNRAAATEFVRAAQDAIKARGRFAVALSGGNTPRGVYSLLAEEYTREMPWDKVFFFFGDERHVPPDHPESNYRMANQTLLSRVPIPVENVFRIQAELPVDEAALRYEEALRKFFQPKAGEWPRFDLILLGMGDDGHTASLFPGTAALEEEGRWVVANHVEKLQTDRITVTVPVLNHAREILFLIAGSGKAEILAQVFHGEKNRFPIQLVRPVNGRRSWILDQAAARLL